MATSYSLESGFVHIALSGTFSMDDALQACRAAIGDPDFRDGTPLLIDLREAADDVTNEQLRDSAAFVNAYQDRFGSKQALLVSDPTHFDRAAIHAVRAVQFGGVASRVFWNLDEAVGWLRKP